MSGFTAVGFFLVSLLFGLVIFILWSRLALRFFRVSSLNSMSQLIHTLTDPVIQPLYALMNQKPQASQRYDWVTFVVLVLVELIKIICLSLLAFGMLMPLAALFLYVLADLIIQPCDLLFYAILIRVIMSYTNPGFQHPIADFLRIVTEPLLKLGRQIIPDISGFDFSPFVAMMILKIISLFISHSLPVRLL